MHLRTPAIGNRNADDGMRNSLPLVSMSQRKGQYESIKLENIGYATGDHSKVTFKEMSRRDQGYATIKNEISSRGEEELMLNIT